MVLIQLSGLSLFVLLLVGSAAAGDSPESRFSSSRTASAKRESLQREMRPFVKAMIQHAFEAYKEQAFPQDEVRPIEGGGVNTLGSYALTLIDALDVLALCGLHDEFRRSSRWVQDHVHFDIDKQVSVFETSIRVLGGLLSAHFMYEEGVVEVDRTVDDYDGGLLRLAVDVADRLLPAFATPTGIPYGSIHLRNGVPHGEVDVTSAAGGGTFLLEMTVISAVTQDGRYERAARKALLALVQHRVSTTNLVGNHINITSGRWTLDLSSVGSGVDSLIEYLIKGYMLTGDPQLYKSYQILHDAFAQHTRKGPWYQEMSTNGQLVFPIHNSLASFYPGNLALSGAYLDEAVETCFATHFIMKKFGAIPEGFHLGAGAIQHGQSGYPLRPEHAESLYMLYRVTNDVAFLEMGKEFARMLWTRTATRCGFAHLKDCTLPPSDAKHDDAMESFVLSETLKYLWLLFDYENVLHKTVDWDAESDGEETVPLWVFNTEGHPLPVRDEWRWWRLMKEETKAASQCEDSVGIQGNANLDGVDVDDESSLQRRNAMAAYGQEFSAWSDLLSSRAQFDANVVPQSGREARRDTQVLRQPDSTGPVGAIYQSVDTVETFDVRFSCSNRQYRDDFDKLSKSLFRRQYDFKKVDDL